MWYAEDIGSIESIEQFAAMEEKTKEFIQWQDFDLMWKHEDNILDMRTSDESVRFAYDSNDFVIAASFEDDNLAMLFKLAFI
jgi:hypothetical protein